MNEAINFRSKLGTKSKCYSKWLLTYAHIFDYLSQQSPELVIVHLLSVSQLLLL